MIQIAKNFQRKFLISIFHNKMLHISTFLSTAIQFQFVIGWINLSWENLLFLLPPLHISLLKNQNQYIQIYLLLKKGQATEKENVIFIWSSIIIIFLVAQFLIHQQTMRQLLDRKQPLFYSFSPIEASSSSKIEIDHCWPGTGRPIASDC